MFWWINEKWTDNNIGDEGVSKISESLKINTTLTDIDLQCDWNATIDLKKNNLFYNSFF